MIDETKLIDELKQSGMIADNEYGNALLDIINSQPKIGAWTPCGDGNNLPEEERKYVIVCNEHTGNWAGVLLFWGQRTKDSEARSFGGYTCDIDRCELYSDQDLKKKHYHFPKYHAGMTIEEFQGYDDIIIEPDCLEKLGYKRLRTWYRP